MPALQLDVRTLLLIFSVTYAMAAVVAVLIWRLNPTEAYTRDWALANIWGAGSVLLLGLRNIAPDLLSIVAANTLIFLNLGATAVALRRFLGAPPVRHWYWSPGAVTAVLFALTTYAWPNALARIEVAALGQAAFCGVFVVWLLRPAAPSLRLAQRVMAAACGLLGAASLARAAVSPWVEPTPDLMQAGPATGAYLLLEILGVTGLTLGWVMLVTNRLQLRLGESEGRLADVASSLHEAVWLRDAKTMALLYVNPAYETIWGRSRASFYANPTSFIDAVHPDDKPRILAAVEAQFRGQPFDEEYRIVRPDGTVRWVWGRTVPVLNDAGQAYRVTAVAEDITQRKQAEEALREEHAQLAQRVEERTAQLRELNAELTLALASRDEFLAAMSHELRTPLTAILGQAEMLRSELNGPLNPQQVEQAEAIYASGQHLLQLINDVLDLARLMSGRLELELAPQPLDELCQACLRAWRREAQKKRQTVHYTPALEVRLVEADGSRLKQILDNLLSNAVKFTPEGGELGLEVQGDPARQVVRFIVWDTGIGVAEADVPRIFQHFVQVDSRLSRGYEGTGMGLALVKRLAELHGGSVAVDSAPGRGSRFTVTLPWKP